MQNLILELRSVTKQFPGVLALDGVSFGLRQGEVHAVAGANGAGKSTLAKIVAGAHTMDSGELLLANRAVRLRSPGDAIRHGIHTIHQELQLAPDLPVGENILLGRLPVNRWGWVDRRRVRAEASDLLRSLGVEIDVDCRVSSLSIAQRQFVEIAKSLGHRCRVLILDEPSAVLGRSDLRALYRVIDSLRAAGTTVLYISHRLEEIFEVSDRVTVLRDGKSVLTCSTPELSQDSLIEAMLGRSLAHMQPGPESSRAEVALEVENLSAEGVHDVSFSVRRGEIVGLAGKIGAGRTEVARAIFGITPLRGGRVRVFGQPIPAPSPQAAIRRGVGLVPEDRKNQGLLLQRNVIENVTIAETDRFSRFGLLALRDEFRSVGALCNALNVVTPNLYQWVQNLSGGNQQKIVLARWLNSECQILILDEPTRGVDVGAKQELYAMMEEFRSRGKAILLISSEDAELHQLADRIVVMREGRMTGVLEREEFAEDWTRVEQLMEG